MRQLTQQQLEQVYREHPEWRTEIEVGKWYKWPDNDNFLFCVTKLLGDKKARGYGRDVNGKWYDAETATWDANNLIPATHEEVEAVLIAEARRRGFKAGAEINNSPIGFYDQWQKIDGDELVWGGSHLDFGKNRTSIFHDSKWAIVTIPENDLSADIQALKDKYPNYNWTIIAEEKQ